LVLILLFVLQRSTTFLIAFFKENIITMNKLFFSALLSFSFTFLIISCDNDEEPEMINFDYHAHINSPSTDDKHVGDSIHIHVDFESHTGETVHHINVKIYNKADNTQVIYNAPGDAHVHAEEGEYGYHADLGLTAEEGVAAHTDWILEAKVWGHEAGVAEVIESIEFHVHPE